MPQKIPAVDFEKYVRVDFVPRWDGVKDAYVVREKDTGRIVTFGPRINYQSDDHVIREEIKQRIMSKIQLKKADKIDQESEFAYRTIRKFKRFKTIRTNKILYGYNVQAVIHIKNIETGEERWSRGEATLVRNKTDITDSFNKTIFKAKNTSTYDMWEILDWYWEYYIPIDMNPGELLKFN